MRYLLTVGADLRIRPLKTERNFRTDTSIRPYNTLKQLIPLLI